MYDNNVYNLMLQLTQEHKSLWRIKNMYKKDAENDEERAFWDKLEKDKEEHIKELTELIKSRVSE
ncbi:hypothetical protein AYK26_07375 [Euryarchaeota archaeon SM23-78]|nr:MAG: hypothetical protein AYK26_07375 [Euryarchaeota archaeon SM23-78]MBW3001281.1 hypothetical protein [Candidatus Woesearchaeota archaeon]